MSLWITSSSVPLEKLKEQPFSLILSYPRPSPQEVESRLQELRELGIACLMLEGKTLVSGLPVLGKGCVSIVTKVRTVGGKLAALKIRRVDANRPSMENEARLLALANGVGAGPKLISSSKNMLLMELINGYTIHEWLSRLRGRGTRQNLRTMIRSILNLCFRLDIAGIDHGELSDLRKHVILADEPCIIDFESASLRRRPANVTSALQYLLIGGSEAKRIRRLLGLSDAQTIKKLAKGYKLKRDAPGFLELLKGLSLLR